MSIQRKSHVQHLYIGTKDNLTFIKGDHWRYLIDIYQRWPQDNFSVLYCRRVLPRTPVLLVLSCSVHYSVVSLVFPSFQTDFWLKEHHWYVECLVQNTFCMVYTVPYRTEFSQLPLQSRRISARFFDDAQIFEHVRKLVVSENDVCKHGKYYFSNVTSLITTDSLRIINEDDERHFIDCLSSLLKLANLKHLELSLDCRSERLFLLLQILQLAPQLSSLCTKRCSFELLAAHYPKSSRCLNDQIRK